MKKHSIDEVALLMEDQYKNLTPARIKTIHGNIIEADHVVKTRRSPQVDGSGRPYLKIGIGPTIRKKLVRNNPHYNSQVHEDFVSVRPVKAPDGGKSYYEKTFYFDKIISMRLSSVVAIEQ